jgi:hypothetical protein
MPVKLKVAKIFQAKKERLQGKERKIRVGAGTATPAALQGRGLLSLPLLRDNYVIVDTSPFSVGDY